VLFRSISEIFEKLPVELEKRNRKSTKFLGKIVIVNKLYQPIRVIDFHELWEQKVATHRTIVVIGMGYVGLTLSLVLADCGFKIVGVESDLDKVVLLNSGVNYIHEVGLPELLKEHLDRNLTFTNELPSDGDVYIIAVGTPIEYRIDGELKPNTDFLRDSCISIAKKLRRGNLVILRSTVPIGTTRNFVKDLLESFSGLICGLDFHLAFAPERTAEGRAIKELRSLPQIIGGFNDDSVRATEAIFRDVTATIVKVDSLEAAEMAKLINNTFRDYIFAFANQSAKVAYEHNIDVFKVINAANEGYIRDPVPLPSPGVGGPCLTKDPHIFASSVTKIPDSNKFFSYSRQINESMHQFVENNVLRCQLPRRG
jgi:nucleotide sugar dehydrogenase